MSINKKVCHFFEKLFLILIVILLSVGSVEVFKYLSKFDSKMQIILAIIFVSSCLSWVSYHIAVKEEELEDDE